MNELDLENGKILRELFYLKENPLYVKVSIQGQRFLFEPVFVDVEEQLAKQKLEKLPKFIRKIFKI